MGRERRHYTDEFKTEAVALLASGGPPLIQIAGELGISPSMLRNWRNRSEGRHAGSALPPNPALPSIPDPAAEIFRLRRENDRLRMKRDIVNGYCNGIESMLRNLHGPVPSVSRLRMSDRVPPG